MTSHPNYRADAGTLPAARSGGGVVERCPNHARGCSGRVGLLIGRVKTDRQFQLARSVVRAWRQEGMVGPGGMSAACSLRGIYVRWASFHPTVFYLVLFFSFLFLRFFFCVFPLFLVVLFSAGC